MDFKPHVRNEFGKCDLPHNTVARIKAGFAKLGLEVTYAPVTVADNIHWGRIWIDSLRIVCLGKGLTPELAQASAYAELAERFSAGLFYQVFEERVRYNIPALYDEPTSRFLNFEWMDGYENSHPDEVQSSHISIETLLANETHLEKADIAQIKESQMARHWVDGYSLMRAQTVKVPVHFITYIHASNGLAAGNTIEEALIQASCEIFERHVQIKTIKPEKVVPTIDIDSVTHPDVQAMVRFYRNNNVQVFIKDLSFDGLLPCIGVLFVNHNLPADRLEHRILIPGAAFNLEEALTRCFTESMQGRTTLQKSRPQLDKAVIPRSQVKNLYLLMKCGISVKDIGFLESGETRPFANGQPAHVGAEIDRIKAICAHFDTDCIFLDHTHPVLGFPVVRVIIPGISDFLPFLNDDILTAPATRPAASWRGQRYRSAMQSFFRSE